MFSDVVFYLQMEIYSDNCSPCCIISWVTPFIIYSYVTSDDNVCDLSLENVREIIIKVTLWILKYIGIISHRNDLPFLSVTKKPGIGTNRVS